jgi:hypothetical protein
MKTSVNNSVTLQSTSKLQIMISYYLKREIAFSIKLMNGTSSLCCIRIIVKVFESPAVVGFAVKSPLFSSNNTPISLIYDRARALFISIFFNFRLSFITLLFDIKFMLMLFHSIETIYFTCQSSDM